MTSSRRASELAHLIESYGGTSYIAPTLGIEVTGAVRDALIEFLNGERLDVVVFLTGLGVESIISAAREAGLEAQLLDSLRDTPTIVARSAKPRSVLSRYGIKDNVLVPRVATFEGIVDLLGGELEGKRVGIFWHGSRSEPFVNSLQTREASVLEFTTYVYSRELERGGALLLDSLGFKKTIPPDQARIVELIELVISGRVDAITFTSPPAVSNFFSTSEAISKKDQVIRALDQRVITVSIGPSTSLELEKHGVRADVEPIGEYKMGRMVHALAEYVRSLEKNKLALAS